MSLRCIVAINIFVYLKLKQPTFAECRLDSPWWLWREYPPIKTLKPVISALRFIVSILDIFLREYNVAIADSGLIYVSIIESMNAFLNLCFPIWLFFYCCSLWIQVYIHLGAFCYLCIQPFSYFLSVPMFCYKIVLLPLHLVIDLF